MGRQRGWRRLTNTLCGSTMNEAEAYELIILLTGEVNQLMFGYFSIVSAFLIMSHLAADRLSTGLSVIAVVLFSLCSFYIFVTLYALNSDLDSLYMDVMTKKAQATYQLAWFGKNPAWVPLSLTFVQTAICLGGYLCSLLFFLSRRREIRHAE